MSVLVSMLTKSCFLNRVAFPPWKASFSILKALQTNPNLSVMSVLGGWVRRGGGGSEGRGLNYLPVAMSVPDTSALCHPATQNKAVRPERSSYFQRGRCPPRQRGNSVPLEIELKRTQSNWTDMSTLLRKNPKRIPNNAARFVLRQHSLHIYKYIPQQNPLPDHVVL